ncbi:ParB/RepB/Spo0J family partition protein [Dermabacteraceae bacterium TAE3-ERU27]|nr:ParB/RepB/Spo0J family partition protein [Dermabacteraceae bacterium TAE3-ERU27]
MTQKRGLGRGLGALIPGATGSSKPGGATPQRQRGGVLGALGTPAEAAPADEAPQQQAEEAPAASETPVEEGKARPVDMFFSGPPSRKLSSSIDLVGDLQKSAVARKARGKKKPAAAAKGTQEKENASVSAGAKEETAKAPQSAQADRKSQEPSKAAKAAEKAAVAPEKAVQAEVGASGVAAAPSPEGEGLRPVPGATFAEIPISEIRENPRNPRTMFDEDALDELAFSLREVGVLQPVVVRTIPATDEGESFELVMGERRWRAAQRAGLDTIPAIIRETTDDDLLRDALLENLHRAQLNPLEEAAAYQQLLEDFGCSHDELSQRIGRSRPQISNSLRLLRLPPLVQRRLAAGAITAGHARALVTLDNPTLVEELCQRIITEGLSVRAVERLVGQGTIAAVKRVPRRTSYDPHVVEATSRLATRFEAPVRIDVGKRKGKITMEFTNMEDLDRLLAKLGIETTLENE